MIHSNVGSAGAWMEGLCTNKSHPARLVYKKEAKSSVFMLPITMLNSKIMISVL